MRFLTYIDVEMFHLRVRARVRVSSNIKPA